MSHSQGLSNNPIPEANQPNSSAEKNPGKPQLGDPSDEGAVGSVGSHRTSGRENEGNKEWTEVTIPAVHGSLGCGQKNL